MGRLTVDGTRGSELETVVFLCVVDWADEGILGLLCRGLDAGRVSARRSRASRSLCHGQAQTAPPYEAREPTDQLMPSRHRVDF